MPNRRDFGITYRRGGADRVFVPCSSRLEGCLALEENLPEVEDELVQRLMKATDKYEAALAMQPEAERRANVRSYAYSIGDEATINELEETNLYKLNPLVS
jgi:hypothetical protein